MSQKNYLFTDQELNYLTSTHPECEPLTVVKNYYVDRAATNVAKTDWCRNKNIPKHILFNAEFRLRAYLKKHASEFQQFTDNVVVEIPDTPVKPQENIKKSTKAKSKKVEKLIEVPIIEDELTTLPSSNSAAPIIIKCGEVQIELPHEHLPLILDMISRIA